MDRSSPASACPDDVQLELLARDESSDQVAELHVRECGRCRAAVREIQDNNQFLIKATQVFRSGERARWGEITAADSMPGYRIIAEIHRGGQGVVYKAYHEPTRRFVAIKLLLQGAFATSRQRHRFEREIEIAAGLRHPSIVPVYDTGALPGGRVGFIMEYVDGVPLDRWAARTDGAAATVNGSQVERGLKLLLKVCDAIRYAHERGIIHRDLKPGNILVDSLDEPHILDFGLAKAVDGALDDRARQVTLTQAGEMVGTYAYAAPEQMKGDPHLIDIRTDVYSLGLIAYEMLTGQLPYPVGGSMSDVIHSITQAEPRPPSALCPSIDDDLDTILLKALAKEPSRRYPSAGALLEDLSRYQRGEAIDAKRDSLSYVFHKYVQRHRLKVAFAATLLVVLVVGLITSLAFWRQTVAANWGLERALEQAEQREKETRQVADFQTRMFADIDPQTMGVRLREDLLIEARAALDRSATGAEQRAARLEQVESLLAGTNFTNAGVRSIDRNVLAPALAAIERDFAGQPLVQAMLWQTIAVVYSELGLNDAALPPAERALETRRRLLGDDHPPTLESINFMGNILLALDQQTEAEAYIREAMEKCRRVLGDDHPETLTSMFHMAYLLGVQGNLSEAEHYLRETLERQRRVLGDDHSDTLESISGMGVVLHQLGRLSEAEPYYHQALEGRRRALGEEHSLTLLSINNLGLLLRAQGRLAEAEHYHREALDGFRRVLGDEHPYTTARVSNLGSVLLAQGRLVEAEVYIREALEADRHALSDVDPGMIYSIRVMGDLLRAQGKLSEAEQYYREALDKCRRLRGEDHRSTISIKAKLDSLLRDEEQLRQSEPNVQP